MIKEVIIKVFCFSILKQLKLNQKRKNLIDAINGWHLVSFFLIIMPSWSTVVSPNRKTLKTRSIRLNYFTL